MFSEPQRTQYDLQFQLFGLPVRISPWFWAVGAILGMQSHIGNMRIWLVMVLCWIAALFVSILVHELGHAIPLAYYFGARTWVVLHGFGGLAIHDPYYRKRTPGTLGTIAYSAAGPGAGFLLAATLMILLMLCGVRCSIEMIPLGGHIAIPSLGINMESFAQKVLFLPPLGIFFLYYLLQCILYISVFWGLVNLLPVYPLDGGKIAQELFLAIDKRNGVMNSLWLSVFVGGGIAVLGLFQWIQGGGEGFPFIAVLFGYLAFQSYQMLSYYRGGFRY